MNENRLLSQIDCLMKQIKFYFFLALITLFFAAIPSTAQPSAPPTSTETTARTLSTLEELRLDINSVPCDDKIRLQAVKSLFEKMGAPAADISIEKSKDVENIVIRKTGKVANEKIIIGAHYDKTGEGSCGAVDNWTGIVAIAHIYKALKDVQLNKTLYFVGFGKEEQGLIGSKAMAKQIKKEDRIQYCSMLNVDTLGLTVPQVLSNVSSKPMQKLAEETAQKLSIPLKIMTIINASSDSDSFVDKNIPAVSIVSLPSNWATIFHGKDDQTDKINVSEVARGYRLALAILEALDEKECGAFRK